MRRLLQIKNVCVTLSLLSLLPLPFAHSQSPADNMENFSRKLAGFSTKLFQELSTQQSSSNIIFSPFSIQTCAAMARLGAEGQTAAELDSGLNLVSNNVAEIAESFNKVLAIYEKSSILRIANKIYVKKDAVLLDEFNSLLTKQFLTSAENVDFTKAETTALINRWVEQQTNNLIKDLIPPGLLDSSTSLVLINAIHFKGNWRYQFPKEATRNERFHLNDVDGVDVPMMNIKRNFRYAKLRSLDAAVLELPYDGSDLSMLIVLPDSNTGLAQLEEKLRSTQLSEITSQMYETKVKVKLPKFKAESNIELKSVFKKLGMSRMFSDQAEFGKMLKSSKELQVSAIIHKAFIEVNEEGTEAAAATAMVMCFASMPMMQSGPVQFYADHPFIYYIINKQGSVFFTGQLLRL